MTSARAFRICEGGQMQEMLMHHIEEALKAAKEKEPSREVSLVITKLDEARLWLLESYQVRGT